MVVSAESLTDGKTIAPVGGARKRALDLAIVATMVVLLVPLALLIPIVLKFLNRGPVFYGQQRLGFANREFTCWKLRSMAVDSDEVFSRHLAKNPDAAAEWARSRKLKNDPRVTPIGRFLRKSSLDELPQLWNVLRGEMSLVGPRPIQQVEAVRYGRAIDHYLAVRPGITGMWQVSGRSATTYERRVALDRHYVTNWRLRRDLGIIVKTVVAVLLQRGSQ